MAASVLCLGAAPDPGGATRLTAAPSIDRSVSQLKGSDTGPADFFGDSVAVSGPTAVVGAADHGDDTGRAYVFTRTTAGWGQAAEVYGINTRANDNFGWSVAIWGTTVVIGAPFRAKDAGRAYVFAETALGWQEVARLQGTDTVVNDDFGDSLAVSGDSVVVGASGHADYAGRAYVFTEIADRWREKAELGGGAVAGDEFGWSVAISGTTAVVGAQGCADDAGRAYVFTRRAGYWELAAELKGSDTAAGDFFGASVAVSRTTVVVGAWGHDHSAGRAYVFTRTAGHWNQVAELKGSDTVAGDSFGDSVAISGPKALVGAQSHAGGAGRAYVFAKTGTGWRQVAEVEAPDTDTGDWFGYSVAISGRAAFVGAPNHAFGSGRAYFFEA